jgi:hypothetical protein
LLLLLKIHYGDGSSGADDGDDDAAAAVASRHGSDVRDAWLGIESE